MAEASAARRASAFALAVALIFAVTQIFSGVILATARYDVRWFGESGFSFAYTLTISAIGNIFLPLFAIRHSALSPRDEKAPVTTFQ